MLLEDLVTEKKLSHVKVKKMSKEDLFLKGTPGQLTAWLNKEYENNSEAVAAVDAFVKKAGKELDSDRRLTLKLVRSNLEDKSEK